MFPSTTPKPLFPRRRSCCTFNGTALTLRLHDPSRLLPARDSRSFLIYEILERRTSTPRCPVSSIPAFSCTRAFFTAPGSLRRVTYFLHAPLFSPQLFTLTATRSSVRCREPETDAIAVGDSCGNSGARLLL